MKVSAKLFFNRSFLRWLLAFQVYLIFISTLQICLCKPENHIVIWINCISILINIAGCSMTIYALHIEELIAARKRYAR